MNGGKGFDLSQTTRNSCEESHARVGKTVRGDVKKV